MKTYIYKSIIWTLGLLFLCGLEPIKAQDDSINYVTVRGIVKDQKTKKELVAVNIFLVGSNIGTVTNEDGAFTLKFPVNQKNPLIGISHLGYKSVSVSPRSTSEMSIFLVPNANAISEIVVIGLNPLTIINKAIDNVAINYSKTPNMLTGFYRETVQKGRKYISVSEAVTDVYKTSYQELTDNDRVHILKGRKLLSQKASDTLAIKLIGGPTLATNMDMPKARTLFLDKEELSYYNFRMEESVNINDKPQYVISFTPAAILPEALFYGTMYIDKNNFTFTRLEFSLSMEDRMKATQAILTKKPLGLRFKPQELTFIVTYKEDNGVAYLNYIKNIIKFKCDWKKKLFSTNYGVVSEMVMTDRNSQNVKPISYKQSFGNREAFYDKVMNFEDPNFWGSYNIIEPSESLDKAVNKLKKQR